MIVLVVELSLINEGTVCYPDIVKVYYGVQGQEEGKQVTASNIIVYGGSFSIILVSLIVGN